MARSVRTLTPLLVLLVLCTNLFGHPDDPKVLDRLPAYQDPGWRSGGTGEGDSASLLGGNPPNFPADGVQLLSWITLPEFGAHASGNDCWGYTAPSGREYAIMGLSDGTGFVEVTNPGSPSIVGVIAGVNSLWRDVKVYGDHAYIVSEGGGGIQIVDLSNIDNGQLTELTSVTTGGTTASHNVAIDEASGFLYRCGGGNEGLRIYSLANPASPSFVASWSDRYVHDAQIVTYVGGTYDGRQIAFCCSGFNGGFDATGLDILDVTNKSNILLLARYEYPNGEYSHQAWLSQDRTRLFLNDELDEGRLGIPTNTKVINVSDLSNPVQVDTFTNNETAVGHNLYTVGNLLFEANYTSGLRIFDVTNPLNAVETAYFDTVPESTAATFNGLWSVYPFFPSGTVIGSDLERGLFVWRLGDPPLSISFPNGQSAFLNPSGDSIRVRIEEVGGTVQPGTAKLHYDAGSGFVTVDLVGVSGDLYDAVFPSIPCEQVVRYYVTASDTTGFPVSSPAGAPGSGSYSVVSAVGETVEFDDAMETNLGWSGGAGADTATTGAWTRVNPIGTAAQPEDDHSNPGAFCWVTGQGSPGGSLGENDVDDGFTTLTTPTLDLSSLSDPTISYWRWFSNNTGGAPETDTFQIDISNNGGSSWTSVETLGPVGNDNTGGWIFHSFTVSDFVTPTANVRMRFIAEDAGSGSIVEAGIDDFRVFELECDAPDTPDLSIEAVQVDYDPADSDLDAGPGNLAQAVNVLVTVKNTGNIPIVSADVQLAASVSGGSSVMTGATVSDFGPGAGSQALDPGNSADVVLSYAQGALDRCGTYTLTASHVPGNLQSTGSSGPILGDDNAANDQTVDTSALELIFGTIVASILPESEVLESLSERLRVSLDFSGVGPGMDSHDVRLDADLTDLSGSVQFLSIFSREKMNVRSSGSRNLVLRLNLSGLSPAPGSGTQYRVRLRLRDLNSSEICIDALTPNSTLVQ